MPKGSPRAQSIAVKTRRESALLLTPRALPGPVLAGRQEKGAVLPFLLDRILRELYVNRLSRHILTDGCAACSGIPRSY